MGAMARMRGAAPGWGHGSRGAAWRAPIGPREWVGCRCGYHAVDRRTMQWRDVGRRTAIAIRIDQVEKVTIDGRHETRMTLTRAEAEAEG